MTEMRLVSDIKKKNKLEFRPTTSLNINKHNDGNDTVFSQGDKLHAVLRYVAEHHCFSGAWPLLMSSNDK